MRFLENLDLTEYNSYRIKATSAKAFLPLNEKDLISIFHQKSNTKKITLGNGNNIILSKNYYSEDFIIFNGCFDNIEVNGNEITAEAGATTLQLSNFALKHCLSGFEIFYDIPSSVGGAVVMNAGASGEEIKDLLLKVRYLDLTDLEIKEINNDEIKFEYRNSFFQRNPDKVIIKAWFRLKKGAPHDIMAKMEKNKKERWAKQPRDYPNCGSVFKRPRDQYVGEMIENLGLKGFRIGGAMISNKHAGFIINYNNATGFDVLRLIDYIKNEIIKSYGVELELEQRII